MIVKRIYKPPETRQLIGKVTPKYPEDSVSSVADGRVCAICHG